MTHRGRLAAVMGILVAALVVPAGTALGEIGGEASYSLLTRIEQLVARLHGWVGKSGTDAERNGEPQKAGAHLEPTGEPQEAGAQSEPNGELQDSGLGALQKAGAQLEPNG